MKQLITAFSIRVKTTVSVPARTAFIIVNALVVFEVLCCQSRYFIHFFFFRFNVIFDVTNSFLAFFFEFIVIFSY